MRVGILFWLVIPLFYGFFAFVIFLQAVYGLQEDAISYADHIRFYTDNLSQRCFSALGSYMVQWGALIISS